ncbi:MAG: hypothetical protein Q7R52_01410 [archaeon]|nr:hypothetical protein [archaeon]
MDTITKYQYAYGGIEDMRKKDMESMDILDSPRDVQIHAIMEEASRGSSLIIPKFLGIYQMSEPMMQTLEETEHEEEIKNYHIQLKKMLDEAGQHILGMSGRRDRFNSELIHVCYDPSFYTRGLVSDLLGEGHGRIGISPYNGCPNFGDKNTVISEVYIRRLKDISIEVDEEERRQELAKIAGEGHQELLNQMQRFGLTRDEYAFLDIFMDMKNMDNQSGLNTNSEISHIVRKGLDSGLLGSF